MVERSKDKGIHLLEADLEAVYVRAHTHTYIHSETVVTCLAGDQIGSNPAPVIKVIKNIHSGVRFHTVR